MRITGFQILPVILFLCFLCGVLSAQNVQVKAFADPTIVGRDEAVAYSLEISSAKNVRIKAPILPAMKDFSLRNMNMSSMSSFGMGGGGFYETVTKTFTYFLLPKRTGNLRIPGLNLNIEGQGYATQPIAIKVLNQSFAGRTPANQGTPRGFGQGLPLFEPDPFDMNPGFEAVGDMSIVAMPEKRSVFLGEPVLVTYRLYTSQIVSSLELKDERDMGGYGKASYNEPTKLNFEVANFKGQRYRTALIKVLAISPNRVGEIEVPRLTVEIQTGSFSLFTKTLVSEPTTIRVNPLPLSGKPDDFSGAVGRFQLSDRLKEASIRLGEAFEYTLTITGKGNFNQFSNPDYPGISNFRTASPLTTDRLQAGTQGTRSIKYLVIPRQEGRFKLSGVSFNWFDPSDQSYHSFIAKPLPVEVKPGNVMTYISNVFQQDKLASLTALQPLKTYKSRRPLITSPLYWILIILILLAFIPSWWLARRNLIREIDPELAAMQGSAKVLRKYLKQAEISARGASQEFYPQAEAGLMRYLGDKFKIPQRYSIAEKLYQLRLKGINEELIIELEAFLKRCQEARYMPGGFVSSVLLDDLNALQKIIRSFIKTYRT